MQQTQQTQQSKPAAALPPFARVIDSNRIPTWSAFHWLALAIQDFKRAPAIALSYGALFAVVPTVVAMLVFNTGNHLIILPATIAFALVGPAFATGLYDTAWQLAKGHQPSFRHSLKSLSRNPGGEWSFAVILVLFMMAWTRIAALIHALYPNANSPHWHDMLDFLAVGTVVGAVLLTLAFVMSAFAPQLMLERRVDVMTAIFSSANAVMANIPAMLVWAAMILLLVGLSLATMGVGFIVTLPLLAFGSWHAYIATIKTKRQRQYE